MDKKIEERIKEMEGRVEIGYPCPDCGEYGGVFAVRNKKTNVLYGYCDECTALWKTPEDNFTERFELMDFEWGGYATKEEIISFGWGKYIK